MPDDDYIDKIAEGGNSMVTGPIQPWETQHIQLAVQTDLSQIHDPREPICYLELVGHLITFTQKLQEVNKYGSLLIDMLEPCSTGCL